MRRDNFRPKKVDVMSLRFAEITRGLLIVVLISVVTCSVQGQQQVRVDARTSAGRTWSAGGWRDRHRNRS